MNEKCHLHILIDVKLINLSITYSYQVVFIVGYSTQHMLPILHTVQGGRAVRYVVHSTAQAEINSLALGTSRTDTDVLVVRVWRRAGHCPVDGQHELHDPLDDVYLLCV